MSHSLVESPRSETRKVATTRYAACGLSIRSICNFLLPLLGKLPERGVLDCRAAGEVVGILDVDRTRVDEFLAKFDLNIPFISATQPDAVEALIRKTRPDVLLVGGPDYTHHEHIVAGLRHGLKVIAEKPMVINCAEARSVLEALESSDGSLVVTHNYRYLPVCRRVKELLLAGKIGRITNIEMVYNLDTRHGASYFYRWNRERQKSGGLSVHKSVHHFDLINWFVGSLPETVFAFGELNYYGPNGAHRPHAADGKKLTPAEVREACPYFKRHFSANGTSPDSPIFAKGDPLELPYRTQYADDMYLYDDAIDIEDTYAAVIKYQCGAMLSYSCNFSTPWEGFILAINGTEGRLEVSHHSNPDPTGFTVSPPQEDVITILPLFGGREEYPVSHGKGGHGGADQKLQDTLFSATDLTQPDSLGLHADGHAGALAVACGEAVWRSAREGRPYHIADLLGRFYQPN